LETKKLEKKIKNKQATAIILSTLAICTVFVFHQMQRQEIVFDENTKKLLAYEGQNLIVIKPVFTATAYSDKGFYDYYNGNCDESCLDIPIREGKNTAWLAWNQQGIKAMKQLGYPMLDDNKLDLELKSDKHFLERYDTVILLHNEYVTREIFEAVINHKNVIYLYPNALYAEINHNDNRIKLIRGHGYPSPGIDNGFGWKFDNTRPDEFDRNCENWFFKHVDNGWQLNCYPELVLKTKPEILKTMKSILNNEQIIK